MKREEKKMEDKFVLGGKEFKSRFILGSGKYNLNLIKAAVEQAGVTADMSASDICDALKPAMKIFLITFRRE